MIKKTVLGCLGLSLAFLGGFLAWNFSRDEQIPMDIMSQIPFVIYIPSDEWRIKKETPAYKKGVLSFTVVNENQNNSELGITQQVSPELFIDVPQYYPALLDRLKKYASFGTKNGTVHLTKPVELKGEQQAILNNNGTLMFVHPDRDMSDDEWRKFFNTLNTVTP